MKRWGMGAVELPLVVSLLFVFGATRAAARAENIGLTPVQQDQSPPPAKPDKAETPARITLPAGTVISIRIADEVNSNHARAGDLVTGTVDPSVFLDDHVIIPRGTEAHMRVMEDKKGGHIHGKADVSLELTGLVLNKEKLDVDSQDYQKKQGALSAKVKGAGGASVSGGTSAATSPNPEGGAVSPIIAVFRAAKVDLRAGTRISFTLTTPFEFDGKVPPSSLTPPGDTASETNK